MFTLTKAVEIELKMLQKATDAKDITQVVSWALSVYKFLVELSDDENDVVIEDKNGFPALLNLTPNKEKENARGP